MVINFNTWWFPIDFNLTRIVSRAISTAALVVTLFPCNAAGHVTQLYVVRWVFVYLRVGCLIGRLR